MSGAVEGQAALACGNDDKGVIGRSVTVNRDAVKRHIGEFFGELIEQRLGNASIGRQITQHGCHVGADHAGALADASDGDVVSA